MNHYLLFPLAATILLINGCVTQATKKTPVQPSATETAESPVHPTPQRNKGASTDLVFNTLAGEIAAQRGDSNLAFDYAYKAALESRSEQAAERATGLGLQANRPQQALQAANLWVEIAPDSLKAHQIAAILYTRLKDLPTAIRHLQQVVKIANAEGQAGYLQAAAIAEKSTDQDEALAIMQQLVPAESTQPDALYALALTANQAKQMQLAEAYVDRALRSNPKATNALVLKAHILIASGKKEPGLDFLAKAVNQFPDNQPLRSAYARILVELNETSKALQQYQTLHRQKPDNPDTLYALAILSMQLEKLDQAKAYLKQLVEKHQQLNEAYFYLGVIAEEEKDLDAALDWYSRVEGERQADAQVRIAKMLADRGNLNQARETLQRLRVEQPQHQLKFFMIEAELLREDAQYAAANEVYSKALEQFEDDTDLLYARGLNAADMDRVDILEQDLRKILATQPDHVDALNALGYTLADKTDRLQEAKGYIERALAMKPDNPAILDSMGWVEFRMGDLNTALDYLQKAAALNPDPEIAAHLGEVLWGLGEKERAREVWREANKLEPDNKFIQPVMQRLGVDH
jgi:tetratricopeptide (TPR) repeat protein